MEGKMGLNSEISWCDHSVNFWMGCKKVSQGCSRCYMFRDMERWGKDPNVVTKVSDNTVKGVLRKAKPGDKIFTCSWSDFFIEEADGWRDSAWKIIKNHPQFIWQILTKRPERIAANLPDDWGPHGYENVWLGVTIESDAERGRLFDLHSIKNAKSKFKTFVSYEPAIGYLDLANDSVTLGVEFDQLNWVIVGGESGNETGKYRYRECKLDWLEGMVRQCRERNIPVFVKQLGTYLANQMGCKDRHGRDIAEFPDSLKFQQFPK
jgi:protein gp37